MRTWNLLLLSGVVCGAVATFISGSSSTAADKPAKVLKHVVMYKFKDSSTPADVQKVIDAFTKLSKEVDTIIGFEHGENVSKEGKSEGLTHAFIVTFRDEAGRDKYIASAPHAEYVKVSGPIKDKVMVFDYWSGL